MAACELTHVARQPIDLELAAAQHSAYEEALDRLGFTIFQLEAQPELPDSVFVEDTAVVLDEIAIITRPGAAVRRAETLTIAEALAPIRPIQQITAPATLDGGDVLSLGTLLFVGQSSGANRGRRQAIERRRAAVRLHGDVGACQRLPAPEVGRYAGCARHAADQSAVGVSRSVRRLPPDRSRPARAARGERAARGRVAALLGYAPRNGRAAAGRGPRLRLLQMSEIAKAEGAVTCCSLLIG